MPELQTDASADAMRLSELAAETDGVEPPDEPDETGKCMICGLGGPIKPVRRTDGVFSSAFTSDRALSDGDGICYRCEHFAGEMDYRRYHWVATPEDRDLAVDAARAAALERGEPLDIQTYDDWRGGLACPSGSEMQRQWGWSVICEDAGVEPGAVFGAGEWSRAAAQDALQHAAADVDGELTAPEYREWSTGKTVPSVAWIYHNYEDWAAACADAGIPHTHPDPETVACPVCDSARIYERTTMEPTYRCAECQVEFDEPVIRERHLAR